MLQRERKLLEVLLKSDRTYTSEELANLLHVSPRTVKKDIKHLKEELKIKDCELNSQAGKGIWLSCNETAKQYLKSLIFDGGLDCSDIPENRKYYVLLKLFDANDYLSMESIADALYVSKGTVVNDVNVITSFLVKQGLVLERKSKHGIRIVGKESRIRIAKAAVINKLVKVHGNVQIKKIQQFFKYIDLQLVSQVLRKLEDRYQFTFADLSYAELLLNTAIAITRIRDGLFCNATESELDGYMKKVEWDLAKYLANEIGDKFHLVLNESEIVYLTMNLLGAKLQNGFRGDGGRNVEDDISLKLDEILRMTEAVYREDILKDESLKESLYMHLQGMFNRINHQIHLDNPIKRMVRDELTYEFEIAMYIAKVIHEQLRVTLGEDEICDIALYLGASFEKRRAEETLFSPTVVIACCTGMGTSLFFEAKLKRIFPDITVRKVLPVSRVQEELDKDYEAFVISTVPLSLDGVKVINVSPVLNERDIQIIRDTLYPAKKESIGFSRMRYPNLFHLLNERISIFKSDCMCVEEVISLMGQRMIREGYVDRGFIESVMKREAMAPTSIGSSIAIPHAFEGYVRKTGIGLMTLKKPITWGDERVQIVMMLGIDLKISNKFKDIFDELADMSKDSEMIKKLLEIDKLCQNKLKYL